MPAHPDGLPAQADWDKKIEPLADYEPQLACAAAPLPGTAALRDLVLSSYDRGSDGGAIRSCAVGGQSEHKEGRAWDWMLDVNNAADRRVAGDFLAWLLATRGGETAAMARRLGVMYVIYNRKIWATYSPGWRDYSSGDPHTSHIHVSMSWNGARGTTSFWNGSVPRTDYGPCTFFSGQPAAAPTSKPQTTACPDEASTPRTSSRQFAWLGNAGDNVRRAQRLLGLDASGTFDVATRKRLMAYQVRHDLPRTGALDEPTWASLDPASRSQSVPDWTPAAAAEWGQGHGSPRLHRSSAGKAVYAVQTALGMPDRLRTGFFGRQTARAVVEFRTAHALPSSPRVTTTVWAALPA
jgi:peptidoglycan hydrolase-like protein with peptidoglycan-binding domain